jgi:transcriptional regulator with XRE-family HTH domain
MRRIRRQELDLSQEQLAKAFGVSSQTISNRERASETPIPQVEELALLYLVSRCDSVSM